MPKIAMGMPADISDAAEKLLKEHDFRWDPYMYAFAEPDGWAKNLSTNTAQLST